MTGFPAFFYCSKLVRSNADVVAHEISHSWTGNLVTNKTWEHFWLNEGFTVFTERKIYGRIYNEQMRHFKVKNKYGVDLVFFYLQIHT